MTRAIVTIALGMDPCYRYGLKSISLYARRCDSELIVIDQDIVGAPKSFSLQKVAWLQKLYVLQLVNEYDEILYLDSDILVTPDALNVFDWIQSKGSCSIAMYNEYHLGGRDAFIDKLPDRFFKAPIKDPFQYFNVGVMYLKKGNLLSELAKKDELIEVMLDGVPCPEQTYYNGVLLNNLIPVLELPKTFNFMEEDSLDVQSRLFQFFIHYAGYSFRERKRHKRSKIMRRDYLEFFHKGQSSKYFLSMIYMFRDRFEDSLFSMSKKIRKLAGFAKKVLR